MALGFRRAPGSSRNYINETTGERLSYRQYDKLIKKAGLHKPMPAERRERQAGPLQRQYNALLETYYRNMRAKGAKITKKEARESVTFKLAVEQIRTKRKLGESVMVRDARLQAVASGFNIIGGRPVFAEIYDNQNAAYLSFARSNVSSSVS